MAQSGRDWKGKLWDMGHLCDLGQDTKPLWVSLSSLVEWCHLIALSRSSTVVVHKKSWESGACAEQPLWAPAGFLGIPKGTALAPLN